jgi:hypothetical protein
VDDAHAGDGDEREREAHLPVQRLKVLEVGAVLSKLLRSVQYMVRRVCARESLTVHAITSAYARLGIV